MKRSTIFGKILFFVGFFMILVMGVSYLFDLGMKSPASTIIGLVFVVVGQKLSRG